MSVSCDDDGRPGEYKPSVFYFRRAIRQHSRDAETLSEIGLALCGELERLKAWICEQGKIPPKWVVAADEAADKGWKDCSEAKA